MKKYNAMIIELYKIRRSVRNIVFRRLISINGLN